MNSWSIQLPTGKSYSPTLSNPRAMYTFCARTFPDHTPIQIGGARRHQVVERQVEQRPTES